MRRAALLAALAVGGCGPVDDTGLSLVARREGEHGYLLWGTTRVREPLELSVEDGERVLFGPPLPDEPPPPEILLPGHRVPQVHD